MTVSGVDTTSIYKQTVKLLEDLKAQFDNLEYQYTSYYLLVFAQILYKRNLKIQALITLREALFTHFCEKYDKGKIGQSYTFEEMKKNKKYEQFDRKCKVNKISDQLYLLRLSRNESAHAGLSLNEGKKVNIDKYNFKEYVNAVKIAFEKCMDTPDE